jgi:hypothetical protein
MNCHIVHLIKNNRMTSTGEQIRSKTQFLFRHGAKRVSLGIAMLSAGIFLGAAVPKAQAQAGVFAANTIRHAIIHKISNHSSGFLKSPLDSNKMMVITPEPGTWSLMTLGGGVGLAAWWLRRRSTQNKISQ